MSQDTFLGLRPTECLIGMAGVSGVPGSPAILFGEIGTSKVSRLWDPAMLVYGV